MSIIPNDIRNVRPLRLGRARLELRARWRFERNVKRWIAGR
ncbi:hypothetical protein [Amnibacterium endophyticum]|uniref:Uncharacterized protein n=1 Tax=Amnibacterium endophyticum TaxID=2109337 RepID=A0ABW4LCQ1_9MICO